MEHAPDPVVPDAATEPRPGLLRRGLLRLDHLDRAISTALVIKPRPDGRPRRRVAMLRRFSETGSYGVGWIVLFAVVGVASDGVRRGLVAAVCVLAMLALNTSVKRVIRRTRPVLRAIEHAPTTFSMPSAHSSMAMVGAATMGVIVPDLALLWWAIAIGLAVSRVMLGMHYFADVVVGALFGLVLGLLVAAPLVASI